TGCNGPKTATHTVTVTPTVGTPVFTLGTTSARCRGAGSVTYTATATNTTGITYSLDAASTTGGNSIDASTGVVTYIFGWSGTSIITASAAGCNGPAAATHTVTIIGDQIWTGTLNTDWNVAGNWSCNFIPDLTTNVQITNVANKPILSLGVIGTAKDITIAVGSSLTVTGNTLQIAGDISNFGTFTASSGTIEMKGTSAQTVGTSVFAGNTIANLTINNSNGVTLLGPLNVAGIVKAQTGNLSSGGNLTLISTPIQTALIDGSGNGQVNGSVTMQRYLPSAFGYKYFSSPFNSATVNEFADDINLAASFPNLYKYDENHLSPTSTDISGWTIYTNPAGTLNPLEGYAVNFGPALPPATADITGVVNNGTVNKNLMNHNRKYTQGFNLVGNPYPSPIDWDAAIGWTKINVDNAIWFFNAGNTDQYTGIYSSYINGVSTGIADKNIASMQGFFVHVTNGTFPVNATLGVTNSVRTNNLTPIFKAATFDTRPILRFTANFETKNAIEDAAVVYFDDTANRHFEKDMDALKMMNTDLLVPNLYTISTDPKQLSINGMPFPADTITNIPLGITTLNDGWINFKAKDISKLPSDMHLYLTDAVTGVTQDLKQYPDYRFYLKTGEYNQRFKLVFSLSDINKPAEVVEKMFTITRSGNSLYVKVNLPLNTKGDLLITNMSGQTLLRKGVFEMETVEINPNVGSGVYIVTMISGKRTESEKILIRKDYE
ncbi:MAG TPA: T9SS type A sorting domain-containing protein, partial [Prolixibacteraceae bacterium]